MQLFFASRCRLLCGVSVVLSTVPFSILLGLSGKNIPWWRCQETFSGRSYGLLSQNLLGHGKGKLEANGGKCQVLTLCLTHSLPPSLLSYSVNMEVIRHYFISTTIGELVHCLATMALVFGVDVWGSLSNLVGMFLSVVTSLNNIPFQRITRSACCLFYYESVKCSHCRQCFVLLSRL